MKNLFYETEDKKRISHKMLEIQVINKNIAKKLAEQQAKSIEKSELYNKAMFDMECE